MSVDEIRAILVKKFRYSEEDAKAIKSKRDLSLTLMGELNSSDKGFLATIPVEKPTFVATDEVKQEAKEAEKQQVLIGSPEWEEYVLSLLAPNEFEDKEGKKYPKANGLRRVAQNLLGAIVESGPVQIFAPGDGGPGRATVVYEVKIEWKHGPTYIMSEDELRNYRPPVRIFRAAADCWVGNTPDIFAVHPVATAESRAEGRAFRRALNLNLTTAEEMNNDKDAKEVVRDAVVTAAKTEWDGEEKIQSNQRVSIENICKRIGIDVNKFVTNEFPEKSGLDQLSKANGAKLMTVLNKYQSKDNSSVAIPEEIRKVD